LSKSNAVPLGLRFTSHLVKLFMGSSY